MLLPIRSAESERKVSDGIGKPGDSLSPEMEDWTRERLAAEVLVLRERLNLAPNSAAAPAGDPASDWDRFRTHLTTVSVPPAIAPVFLKAQAYVARYFSERIHRPDEATISIAGERYVLLRAASMSVEFVELVMSLFADRGPAEARNVANNLLFDLAHAIGKADARRFHDKMGVTDPIERLSAGPIHFAFSGWASVRILPESRPSADDDYLLVFDHPFSFESHAWIERERHSDTPVCIMSAGYSSGWCAESFGIPLVSAEIECVAAGGSHCRFIMAPPSRIEEHLARRIAVDGDDTQARLRAAAVAASGAVPVPEFFQRLRMEEELRQANDLLERRVLARTTELSESNQHLEREIAERRLAEEQLRRQALHDALTGLPNRLLLYDRLEQGILKCSRTAKPLGLLFMDLNGFKEINDTFGHQCGDEMLRQVGSRLSSRLRTTDTVARLGGDEFAILLPDLDDLDKAVEVAHSLLASLVEPLVVEGQQLTVGAAIGIVLCPQHGADPLTLMRRADVAMYAAKHSSRGHSVYSAEIDAHSPARLTLLADLRRDSCRDQFQIYFQPEVEFATGRVRRAEALARWQHPELGLLLPRDFIPLAEAGNLVHQVTRWALEAAIQACRRWQRDGLEVGVSVNLSPRDLREAGLAQSIAATLDAAGLEPRWLTLEITEGSLLADPDHAIALLRPILEAGVGLSIDDFGTGYSSLSHMKQLPASEIKIDRNFVHDMTRNEPDAIIVRSLIELGHSFGRQVVAEGIHDLATWNLLASLGCDLGQGFLISPALAESAAVEWMLGAPWRPPAS
jgi:diguanylate cyclase (GGDEF)-like protein